LEGKFNWPKELFWILSKDSLILEARRKKNTCGSGSQPTLFFSADPIIFSTRLTVRPYFLRVVAGCCQNGVCCHTNYWKNHEKNLPKFFSRPTDPNFFAIWNRNLRFFLRPM
jgi:hypothetical protein